jgi:hypothetical protein
VVDAIPLDEFEREAQREHARVVSALRDLADRLERLPEWKLREALPVAGWASRSWCGGLIPGCDSGAGARRSTELHRNSADSDPSGCRPVRPFSLRPFLEVTYVGHALACSGTREALSFWPFRIVGACANIRHGTVDAYGLRAEGICDANLLPPSDAYRSSNPCRRIVPRAACLRDLGGGTAAGLVGHVRGEQHC